MASKPVAPVTGGILLLDKPTGLSSNDALQRVRRAYGRIKAGHTGTLDPLASGMLPICLGEATKVAGEILAGRKCYRFTLQLGEQRSTGDAEGAVVATQPVPPLDALQLRTAIEAMTGPQQQVPPMYSAIKRAGQPLYKLARAGITVERAARDIRIDSLELLRRDGTALELRTLCSKGTYVRVLGEDLAARLGTVGYLTALRREYVEPFEQQAMVSLDAVLAGPLPVLLPADEALPQLSSLTLTVPEGIAITQGRELQIDLRRCGGPVAAAGSLLRLYDAQARFFGLGTLAEEGRLRARRLYAQPPLDSAAPTGPT